MARKGISAVVLAVVICLAGCGGSGPHTTASTGADARVPTHKQAVNGEASIEEFGREASQPARSEVLESFHSYLRAVAARKYADACSHLSEGLKASLTRLTERPMPCTMGLQVLFSPSAAATAASQDKGAVTRVRVRNNEGFVVFKAPGASRYQVPMTREGTAWRVAAALGAVLVPSPSSFNR